MSNLDILALSEDQKIAVDFVAMTPGITNRDLAKAMDKCEHTISSWRKNGTFIDACYNRFIELNGTRLMSVMESMFREAEEGSVHFFPGTFLNLPLGKTISLNLPHLPKFSFHGVNILAPLYPLITAGAALANQGNAANHAT